MADLVALLRANPIFRQTSDAALARFAGEGKTRVFAPGEAVLTEGEPARSIHVLVQGRVRVFYLSAEGDRVVAKLFRAPALFGEAEALSGDPYLENVDALDEATIAIFPVEALVALLEGEPRAAVAMVRDVASRLAIAAYHEKSLAFHPATIRLANFLLDYADWDREPSGGEWKIALNQDDMAAALGVTRRSIAKDIIAWQEEGILERREKQYVVRDVEALRRYADPARLALTYSLAKRTP
jgi:CRP-like cAMP-binding protein